MIPAHKQTDPMKKPGQIINSVKTLGEYVEKIVAAEAAPRKLLFEEWIDKYRAVFGLRDTWGEWDTSNMYDCWCAAQENK